MALQKPPQEKTEYRPFVKWAGGKRQLLHYILPLVPDKFNRYFEAFAGGAALFFALRTAGYWGEAYLFDNNSELINCYTLIKERYKDIIKELKSGRYLNSKETYYRIRSWEPSDPVERAARFIYLNRTGYNGLYRVNKSGAFNVPFGRYKNPLICDEQGLEKTSEALQNTVIACDDFAKVLTLAKENDFIYFDPPYAPVSSTANFTQYTSGGFGDDEQKRLSRVFNELNKKNCYVMLSNSDVPELRTYYNRYNIATIKARRAINCVSERRGVISELLILNYNKEQIIRN